MMPDMPDQNPDPRVDEDTADGGAVDERLPRAFTAIEDDSSIPIIPKPPPEAPAPNADDPGR